MSEWREHIFTDVFKIQGGSQPAKKEFIYEPKDGYIRLLQIRDFGNKPFPTYVPVTSKLKICNPDDVLIGRYGGQGKILTGMYGAYNVAIAKVIIPDTVNSRFAYHLLKSDVFYGFITNIERSAIDGFNKDDLSKLTIRIPPTIEEQKQIVERLEARLEKLNTTRQKLEKIPLILKRFRQSVLASACDGRLTASWRENNACVIENDLIKNDIEIFVDYKTIAEKTLPETWKWTALANYAKCSRGRFSVRPRNDPTCYDGDYPFIQIGDLPREGGYIKNHSQTLNDKGLSVSKMFPANTVAIAIVGATIANTGILDYPMCFPDSLVGMETGNLSGNKYIEYYMRLQKETLRQISYAGGGQPNIKLKTLEPFPLPLPPLPEQEEIVRRIDKLFAIADSVEKRYNNIKVKLDKAEKSLYAKAFRGEL